ncbi:hypothetical protein HAX54_044300 [Datura stramonium]|uniref:Uncharacterized protein n=1 Tax=Datura stramonium TaxID=4076 RepID=A0ABS8W5V7_DATST|nr:hypothetical protein [Datura stramonium]
MSSMDSKNSDDSIDDGLDEVNDIPVNGDDLKANVLDVQIIENINLHGGHNVQPDVALKKSGRATSLARCFKITWSCPVRIQYPTTLSYDHVTPTYAQCLDAETVASYTVSSEKRRSGGGEGKRNGEKERESGEKRSAAWLLCSGSSIGREEDLRQCH